VVIASVLIVAAILATGPLIAFGVPWALRLPSLGARRFLEWIACDLGGGLAALAGGEWLHLAAWGASGLLGLVLWWWSRRKGRRKALRLLGGKARAVLAAMARNMPRLSPRLVPQGARA
jgi:hypothetical protein